MGDGIDQGSNLGIGKNPSGQSGPVELAVRLQDLPAERLGQAGQGGRARGHHLPGQLVGADHSGPELTKDAGYQSFSGGDSSGDTEDHDGSLPDRQVCGARGANRP